MRVFYSIILSFFASFLLPVTSQAQQVFEASLSGRNEVLPVASRATGALTATLDGNQLVVEGSFSGLSSPFDPTVAGGSHLHIGYAGQNGGIAVTLIPNLSVDLLSGSFTAAENTFVLTDGQRDALLERRMYVNIHTVANGGGELRGQLLPQADAYYTVNLLASNEVPAVLSRASGGLALELNGNELTLTGSFAGLEGDFNANIMGGAHLHLGLPGANGPIAVSINASPDAGLRSGVFTATDNTINLTNEQVAALRNRGLYANIHTVFAGSGELRGQVSAAEATAVFRAHLSGANENPVVTSSASGVVQAEAIGDSLIVYGAFSGLESPVATSIGGGAHIHTGLAGSNGGVTFPLSGSLDAGQQAGLFLAAANRYALNAEQMDALFERGFYVNIHSQEVRSGEIRGQLLPEAQVALTAPLSGGFELPALVTRASGAVKAELRGNELTVSGSFAGLSSAVDISIAGGAHLHFGLAGTNGPVVFPLILSLDGGMMGGSFAAADNTFTLTNEQVAAILNRSFYVNIHTLTNGGGELRGQLLPEANFYLAAPLSGASERPAVNTGASGTVMLEITGNQVIATGGFSGLESPFDATIAGGAHLHTGLAGTNGPILENLNATAEADLLSGVFTAEDNTFTLEASDMNILRERGIYVNIHTEANPSGELRGQVLPFATAYLTATLASINEVQPVMGSAMGALKLELNGEQLAVTGSFSGLESEFDASVGGGAHLHIGGPGESGGVDVFINAVPEADLLSGAFLVEDNTFDLTPEQIGTLVAGGYYANIHTVGQPRGEVRGQVLPEVNFFPSATADIALPPDGASLLLEGGLSAPFQAQWLPATDGNAIAYIWQLSTDADFENIVFQQNVGSSLAFTTDFGTVDGLLESLGVMEGGSVTVYHRTLASDGSVAAAGAGASVTLTRGELFADNYKADLSGHNEVFPIATTASGLVNATLDGNELTVSGSFEGLSSPVAIDIAGGAHIHVGYAGQNGPVLYPLVLTLGDDMRSGSFAAEDNTFTLSDEELELLIGRQLYVNIHSENYRGGELRSQMIPSGSIVYTASLFGSNEVPSVESNGGGALVVEANGDDLIVTGAFSRLSSPFEPMIGGGAHLHSGLAGQNGGVAVALSADTDMDLLGGVFNAEDNTFPLAADLMDALEGRALYANIHTLTNPAGELRGQVAGPAKAFFRAHLSGSNESPVVTSYAGGELLAELVNDSTLTVSGAFSGLESPLATDIGGGAHIHLGLPGENGAVIFPLTVSADGVDTAGIFLPADNTFRLNEVQRRALLNRSLYINIHSQENRMGEIRGQLLLESQSIFTGFLSGIFEVPEASSSASGALQAELSGNRLTLVGSFAGLSSPVATDISGGAHIHVGLAGTTGNILYTLVSELDSDELGGLFPAAGNTFIMAPMDVAQMRRRGFYVNIHSEDIPSGELRAQLLHEATAYFVAPLSGASEASPVRTGASGMAILEVNGNRITATGTANNLSSPIATNIMGGAHVHTGYAGQNGPINLVLGINPDNGIFGARENVFLQSEGWVDSLRTRQYYVNVHTQDFASGELRGQLLPLATSYFTTTLAGRNEVQPVITGGMGAAKMELTGNTLALSGAFSALTGNFDATVAGGSHLHIGGPGENGGLDITLMPIVDADLKGGFYPVVDNTYELDDEQAASLRAGDYYFNIHTTDYGSGEIRGQLLPEINFFPSDEADITTPPDGAMVAIQGDPATPFVPGWTVATDRDELAYIWQLAADTDFNTILVSQNVGAAQTFETTFGVVDMLLEQAGVGVGESITLYHRALASDGSVATPGASASVMLARGIISSTATIDKAGLNMKVFPTITRELVNVRLQSSQPYSAHLLLSNANGQVLDIRPLQLPAGTLDEQVDVQRLPAGSYYLQLVVEGQAVETKPFIVE